MSSVAKPQAEPTNSKIADAAQPQEAEANPWSIWGTAPELIVERYELTRSKLIMYFAQKRVADPEDLASKTLLILMKRVMAGTKVNSPEAFSFGIAKNVFREYCRRERRRRERAEELKSLTEIRIRPEDEETSALREQQLDCATECVEELSEQERMLLAEYDNYPSGADKIKQRKELAEMLKMTKGALSSKIFNIKKKVKRRLAERLSGGDQTPPQRP